MESPSQTLTLTEREKETLRLLLRGHDAKSIARELDLSVHTVNERLRDARRKLNVSSSREAARRLAGEEQGSSKNSADNNFGVVHEPAQRSAADVSEHGSGLRHQLVWLAGGMLVMSLVITAAALLLTFQGHVAPDAGRSAATAAASFGISDPVAATAAKEWVALLDDHQWEESWRDAAALFKSKISAAQWTAMVQPIRQPLGAVSSRTIQSTTRASSLPGESVGDYEVLQFLTNFAKKPGSVETVALSHEGSGWKVTGYYIR